MIIIKLMGGLGNQLQQYSLYRRLVDANIDAKIDISWFDAASQEHMKAPRKIEIDYIDGVKYEIASKSDVKALTGGDSFGGKLKRKFFNSSIHICNESSRIYMPELIEGIFDQKTIKDMYLEGYFACEYYHENVLSILRNELRFPIEKLSYYDDVIKITNDMKNANSVSVHLRRGDYLDPFNQKMFGGICTDEYYFGAISSVINSIPAPKFYFFSDDIEFAKRFNHDLTQRFPGISVEIVDKNHGENNYFDIYLMSQCKHNITANSTFSFWGARLNDNVDKLMIRPTVHANGQEFDEKQMKIWWKGWKFVSPTGEVY